MSARFLSLVAGLLIAAVAYFGTEHVGLTSEQSWTAAVTALCAMWWVLEVLPLPATALVPLVIFPLTGVLTEREAAASYGDPIILLFMGGFMLSKAIEHWGAHRQIAQITPTTFGDGAVRFGVSFASIAGGTFSRVVMFSLPRVSIVPMTGMFVR